MTHLSRARTSWEPADMYQKILTENDVTQTSTTAKQATQVHAYLEKKPPSSRQLALQVLEPHPDRLRTPLQLPDECHAQ
ncbi:unnamed protein product, partial [Arctogadus glacialis]